MLRQTLLVLAALAAMAENSIAGPFDDGLAAYERQDFAKAFRLWRPLATQGDASAQFSLGVMYDLGQGVRQDAKEAMNWYRRAAEGGNAFAQTNLGIAFHIGKGIPSDVNEAVKWFRLAAAQGESEAQFRLGYIYDNGKGVPKDDREAMKWYRLAAGQNHTRAQRGLGMVYFAKGREDYVRGLMWVSLAVSSSSDEEQKELTEKLRVSMAARMTPAQIKQAQTMETQCRRSSFKQCGED